MASYSLYADNISKSTPKLTRGEILIEPEVTVYYRIGNDPVADNKCAFIRGGESLKVRLPTNCLQVAVLAASTPGAVMISEVNPTLASCFRGTDK